MEQNIMSCEQFIIHDLLEARNEIEKLKKDNDDLKNLIKEMESSKSDNYKTIEKCGLYFKIAKTDYVSDFSRLSKYCSLENIQNAIDLAENDIFDDLDEIRNLNIGYDTYIAKCIPDDYTHLIVYGGREFVVSISTANDNFYVSSIYIDKKRFFLNEKEAIKQARKIAIENLKKYVKWYKENHKEDEE